MVTAEFIYEDCFATVHAFSAMPQTAPFIVGCEAVFEKGFVMYFEDGYADGKLETKLEIFTYLLNISAEKKEEDEFCPSIYKAYEFFQECGYFFLATSNEGVPSQRPMGMMYSDEKFLGYFNFCVLYGISRKNG